jgi:hypothetical protein
VGIHVVEERRLGAESKRDGQAAAEGLYKAAVFMPLPKGAQERQLPPLTSSPLQRGRDAGFGCGAALGNKLEWPPAIMDYR